MSLWLGAELIARTSSPSPFTTRYAGADSLKPSEQTIDVLILMDV
jgi:hypothetical protein